MSGASLADHLLEGLTGICIAAVSVQVMFVLLTIASRKINRWVGEKVKVGSICAVLFGGAGGRKLGQ